MFCLRDFLWDFSFIPNDKYLVTKNLKVTFQYHGKEGRYISNFDNAYPKDNIFFCFLYSSLFCLSLIGMTRSPDQSSLYISVNVPTENFASI